MHNKLTFLALMLLAVPLVQAQRPYIHDFSLRGDAYLTDEDCFRLTEAIDYASGSIWYKRPISLKHPFSVELSMMFGCQDESGADGMVFVFTAQANRLGFVGEGIGFGGLVPSVGIEVDTWRNYHLNDPAEDHLAIMLNGRVGHFGEFSTPVRIPNVEDCARHSFIVSWMPGQQQLSVALDGQVVARAKVDLMGSVFGGEVVYWGVTAATGRYNNVHEVCFDRISQGPEIHQPPAAHSSIYRTNE